MKQVISTLSLAALLLAALLLLTAGPAPAATEDEAAAAQAEVVASPPPVLQQLARSEAMSSASCSCPGTGCVVVHEDVCGACESASCGPLNYGYLFYGDIIVTYDAQCNIVNTTADCSWYPCGTC